MNPIALESPLAIAPLRPATADEWTDVRLVRECLDGNEKAWAALLDNYKRLIYSIPVKYGFSPDESSDIFQEVCVELLSELPRLREPRALPKWLMQVTAHKCGHLKQRDRRQRHAHDTTFDGAEVDRIADDSPASDEILFDVEQEQALRDAVSSLSPRCRQLVEMLFFESPARPYKEIAEHLGMACGSIGFIRGRCLQRLRAQLQKHGFR
jgi:RNA polymerase sigma factor (sigma-70 family)